MNSPPRTALAALIFALATKSVAQETSVPLAYTGSNARVGLAIDHEGAVSGEALGVAGYDGERAFLMQGWLDDDGSGGVQAGYNWLWGKSTRQDTISRPLEVIVAKAFVAADRNGFHDSKASIGIGFERAAWGLDIYYSRALTDERAIGSNTTTTTQTITGTDNGRRFEQDITTQVLVEQFEHAYDQGIGLRFSRFHEHALLKWQAGVDYEVGDALLQGEDASQFSVSAGLEKFFEGSRHSVGLELEHLRKDDSFDDTRARLQWRYSLGDPFRARQLHSERRVTHTAPPPPPPKPEIRRVDIALASQALFELDRHELSAAARQTLNPLLQQLKNRRVGDITIVGHTCDLGSDEYNQALSERRAGAVRDWLIAAGVPADVVVATGRGESQPTVPNDSETNRARNRRIELSFLSYEEQTVQQQAAAAQTTVEIIREPIPTPAAWIERALRTPPAHKRTVDTYRIEKVTQTLTEGPRRFLNHAPIAVDDTATTGDGDAVTINVLANDSDPDGDTLVVTISLPPATGTAVLNADSTITFQPVPGGANSGTFEYTIRDSEGLTATATVTVSER